jgi:hypothetical protein
MGRIAAAPDRRQGKQADQIVDAALKAPDLAGEKFGLRVQVKPPSVAT